MFTHHLVCFIGKPCKKNPPGTRKTCSNSTIQMKEKSFFYNITRAVATSIAFKIKRNCIHRGVFIYVYNTTKIIKIPNIF
jgi:hypothetical protein